MAVGGEIALLHWVSRYAWRGCGSRPARRHSGGLLEKVGGGLFGCVCAVGAERDPGFYCYSILEKGLAAAFADKMSHIRVQVGELVSKYGVGEQAGAKGLPEGLGLVFGHDVLAVVARDQHHDMAGALAAAVATMDFARFAQGCHTGVALEVGGRPS